MDLVVKMVKMEKVGKKAFASRVLNLVVHFSRRHVRRILARV